MAGVKPSLTKIQQSTQMSGHIHPEDLGFFSILSSAGSLSAAARELGITTPAVSKRLAQIESRLGLSLVVRSTRRMSLTPEGEIYLERARSILSEIRDMEEMLGGSKAAPKGLLRVNATLGFGRSHIAPLISRFAKKHPQVDIQLQLSVNPPPLTEDVFDICIRFGAPPESRVVARKLAPNRRILCASPGYLNKFGTPKLPAELSRHNCIGIRQGEEAYGVWKLTSNRGKSPVTESVKTRGSLTTNDGEIAVNWALDGHGIIMRAEWDVGRYLQSGRLVQVLPQYHTPDADIYAVFHAKHQMSARVRAFVDFAILSLSQQAASHRTLGTPSA